MTYGWNTFPQNCFPTFVNGFVPQSCWPTNQWPTPWTSQWNNQPNAQFANPWTTPYAYGPNTFPITNLQPACGIGGCAPQFAQYPAPYANQYSNPQFIGQPTFNFPYAGINQPTNLWTTIPTFSTPVNTPWNATPWNSTPWSATLWTSTPWTNCFPSAWTNTVPGSTPLTSTPSNYSPTIPATPNTTSFPQGFSPFATNTNPLGFNTQASHFATPTQGFAFSTQVNGNSPTQYAINQYGQLGIFGTQHFQHHYPAPTTLSPQYPNQFTGQFPGQFQNPLAQNWTNVLPVTNYATPYTPGFNTAFNPGFNPGFAPGFIPGTTNGFAPTAAPGSYSPLTSPIGTPINTQPFPGNPLETIEPNGQHAQAKRQSTRAGV